MNARLFLTLLLPVNVGIASLCHWNIINRILVILHSCALLALIVFRLVRGEADET